MTDQELLEAAARAAGLPFTMTDDQGRFRVRSHPLNEWELWRPLTDDGDALRLAVKLNLQVTPGTYRADEATAFHAGMGEAHERVHYQQDLLAATRRAIVRAAAEISKEKRPQDNARGL